MPSVTVAHHQVQCLSPQPVPSGLCYLACPRWALLSGLSYLGLITLAALPSLGLSLDGSSHILSLNKRHLACLCIHTHNINQVYWPASGLSLAVLWQVSMSARPRSQQHPNGLCAYARFVSMCVCVFECMCECVRAWTNITSSFCLPHLATLFLGASRRGSGHMKLLPGPTQTHTHILTQTHTHTHLLTQTHTPPHTDKHTNLLQCIQQPLTARYLSLSLPRGP